MIYFIQTADNRYTKIGKADKPIDRFRSLQTGHPEKLKLFSVIHGGLKEEQELHSIQWLIIGCTAMPQSRRSLTGVPLRY